MMLVHVERDIDIGNHHCYCSSGIMLYCIISLYLYFMAMMMNTLVCICSFEKLKASLAGEQQQEGQSTAGGYNTQVHMMSEEEYIEYCKNYMSQMGMPFNEAMVKNHYHQMKASAKQ